MSKNKVKPVETKEESAAAYVALLASTAAERAQILGEYARKKLACVMREERPDDGKNCATEKSRDHPPLFSELRENLILVHEAMNTIQQILGRVDI